MVSPLEAVGLAVVVVVHTFVTVAGTRFFRLQMSTRWGKALYAAVFVPMLLVVSTLVLTGALGLGADVGREGAVMLVLMVPLVLGFSLDLFWLPSPEEVGLPDTAEEGSDPDGR